MATPKAVMPGDPGMDRVLMSLINKEGRCSPGMELVSELQETRNRSYLSPLCPITY